MCLVKCLQFCVYFVAIFYVCPNVGAYNTKECQFSFAIYFLQISKQEEAEWRDS